VLEAAVLGRSVALAKATIAAADLAAGRVPSSVALRLSAAYEADHARRQDVLVKLQSDMLAAIEKMPEDWDEIELCWYLLWRAELFSVSHVDRLRRKAHEHALRSRGL
jgi:hypothetical protein